MCVWNKDNEAKRKATSLSAVGTGPVDFSFRYTVTGAASPVLGFIIKRPWHPLEMWLCRALRVTLCLRSPLWSVCFRVQFAFIFSVFLCMLVLIPLQVMFPLTFFFFLSFTISFLFLIFLFWCVFFDNIILNVTLCSCIFSLIISSDYCLLNKVISLLSDIEQFTLHI